MSYYEDVYLRRVNRYGNDYATRLQSQRERVFEDLLLKSIYRVDFEYNNSLEPGLLERFKQDDTQTIQYLLTRVNLNIPHGTVLTIPDKDGVDVDWMIFYLESIQTSGYNRYFVLKMTHKIKWFQNNNFQGTSYSFKGYFFGPHNAAITAALSSDRQSAALFEENDNYYHIIMPTSANLKKDSYFEITATDHAGQSYTEHYRVLGIDNQSNPGVSYVTVDPIYEYDKSPTPVEPPDTEIHNPDFDWFNGNFGGDK